MACKYCNCGCGCCSKLVKTTQIKAMGDELILTIPDTTLYNGQLICVCLAQNIPEIPEPVKVIIETGGEEYIIINTSVPCYCSAPTYLYSDQLERCRCNGAVRPRQIINLRFAADTLAFRYAGPRRILCPTKAAFKPVTPSGGGFWGKAHTKTTDKVTKGE